MTGFEGEQFFLHPRFPALVESKGVFHQSVAHALTAYRGGTIPLRDCVDEMTRLNRQKFTMYPELASALVRTGRTQLIHVDPQDTFFGTWYGKGENQLGKILMELRRELRSYT